MLNAKNIALLGGWLLNEKGESSTAPWFSLSLSAKEVPWLFREDGETSWASTSAELLASLVAIKVLPFEKLNQVAWCSYFTLWGWNGQQSSWFFGVSKIEHEVTGDDCLDGVSFAV